MKRKFTVVKMITALAAIAFSAQSYSEETRFDFDLDDDGLIEINDITDLKALAQDRGGWTLGSKALYGKSDGCPAPGCDGYELTADLDLSSIPNWQPIPTFSGIFEGNGYSINNLSINTETSTVGLIVLVKDAIFRNLNIGGDTSVTGYSSVALLAALVEDSLILSCKVKGKLVARAYAAGFAGEIKNSTIANSTSTVTIGITSEDEPLLVSAGLVGLSEYSTYIANTANVEFINGASSSMLFIGSTKLDNLIANIVNNSIVDNSPEPKLPLMEDLDDEGHAILIAGDETTAPSIAENLVFLNSDNDVALNRFDDYPNNSAVYLDSDGDAAPNAWSGLCSEACQLASGLTLDAYPYTPQATSLNDTDAGGGSIDRILLAVLGAFLFFMRRRNKSL